MHRLASEIRKINEKLVNSGSEEIQIGGEKNLWKLILFSSLNYQHIYICDSLVKLKHWLTMFASSNNGRAWRVISV